MTASISAEMQAHLDGNLTTTTQCVYLKTLAGDIFGFTALDQDLVIDGVRYLASASANASQITGTSGLDVDNLEISGALAQLLTSGNLTEQDVLSGVFDGAEYRLFLVNFCDLSMGTVDLLYGTFGDTTVHDGQYESNILGLTDNLAVEVGTSACATCRYTLGDQYCGVDTDSMKLAGTLVSMPDSAHVVCTDAAIVGLSSTWANEGKIVWTSGINKGRAVQVRGAASGTIELWEPMYVQPAAGDTFYIYPGCDGQYSTCTFFSNWINFGGQKDVPGADLVNTYA